MKTSAYIQMDIYDQLLLEMMGMQIAGHNEPLS